MGGRRVPGGAIGQRVPHDPLGVGKATSSSTARWATAPHRRAAVSTNVLSSSVWRTMTRGLIEPIAA